jgi:hypothetical protein
VFVLNKRTKFANPFTVCFVHDRRKYCSPDHVWYVRRRTLLTTDRECPENHIQLERSQ